jgi:hypothetical protein
MTLGEMNTYALTKISTLSDEGLIGYLMEFGIPATTAKKYLKQAKIYDRQSQSHFLALAMLNEDEGYELRNLNFSEWLGGDRDISFIRGRKIKPPNIHVFFDMVDFLSVVARTPGEAFADDAIILHTNFLLHKVPPYLYQYRYKNLYGWMENNSIGRWSNGLLSAFCTAEPELQFKPQNLSYAKYETITEYFRRHGDLTK